MDKRSVRAVFTCLLLVGLLAPAIAQPAGPPGKAEAIAALLELESQRQSALTRADVEVLERLHAPDFLLINPYGRVVSRHDFLRAISSGELKFVGAEQNYVDARVYGDSAVVRQRVTLQIENFGERLPTMHLWEMLVYELRDGQWQAVWSVGSEIRQ
ncbi:MAG TPA: nuclear transport factor 2 family protein [Trueperaceae bacterium]